MTEWLYIKLMSLPIFFSYVYKHHRYLSLNQTNFSSNENKSKTILIYYHSLKKFTERFLSYYGGSGAIMAVLEQKHPKMSKLLKF